MSADGTPDLEAQTLAHMRQDTIDLTETRSSRLDFDYVELHEMIDGLIESLNVAVEHVPPGLTRALIVRRLDQLQHDGFMADK